MLLPLLNGTATARWRVSVLRLQNGAGVRVTRTLPDIVQLAEIYSADPSAPSAVRVKLLLVGLGGDERARPPLRLPVSTVVSFEPALAEAVSATVAPPLNRQHRPAAAQLTTPPRADADRGSRGGPPGIEAATTTAPTSGWTHSGHPTATGASGRAPTTMASCTAPDHTPVIWWSLHLWRCSQRKGESGWRTDFFCCVWTNILTVWNVNTAHRARSHIPHNIIIYYYYIIHYRCQRCGLLAPHGPGRERAGVGRLLAGGDQHQRQRRVRLAPRAAAYRRRDHAGVLNAHRSAPGAWGSCIIHHIIA